MLAVLATLVTAFVFGGMAFFSFVVAPLVFRRLEHFKVEENRML